MATSISPKPVGLLSCQQQPFLKTLDTHVVSCTDAPNADGLYEVELEDTVIFPEGGGQPSDTGSINGIAVKFAKRDGLRAIHYTESPVATGAAVHVSVDFARRLDHMQQHSGQHLISAVLERDYGLDTVSWNLGEKSSHVELKTAKDFVLEQAVIDAVEERCNKIILDQVAVSVRVFEQGAGDCPSSVPEDYIGGVIRYVDIGHDGLFDSNACCGTHITSTSQLQAVKLGATDRIRGGNTRLFFYVGGRVRQYAHESLARDRRLTELLSCGPEAHSEAVDRLLKQSKQASKSLRNLRRQLAPLVAGDLAQQLNESGKDGLRALVYHNEDGDGQFANGVVSSLTKQVKAASWLAVVACGTKAEGGPLVVAGSSEEAVARAIDQLGSLLGQCKGGAKRGVWQGKAASFNKLGKFAM